MSSSAASGLVWKCSLEGQHIFSIMAARIVAELRRFVAESFIGADGYRRRKGRNKDGSRFVHDCPRRDVSSCLGPSWRSGLGLRGQYSDESEAGRDSGEGQRLTLQVTVASEDCSACCCGDLLVTIQSFWELQPWRVASSFPFVLKISRKLAASSDVLVALAWFQVDR